jgi:ubiquinone/menaquinone biosynthesis C-methylase UbiE
MEDRDGQGEARIEAARRYDDVAAVYEQVNAPLQFDSPARALVAFAAPVADARVLDVGSGTGAVAAAARDAAGGRGWVVSADPSLPMLEAAGRRGIERRVAGALPDLPFVEGAFDVVFSAFVMTHLDDPAAGAAEMRRVLRPGGMIALSAWGPSQDAHAAAWQEVVDGFVERGWLDAAAARVMPWESRFARAGGLESLLAEVGFARVRAETRELEFALTSAEYVASREVAATGRALRALLSPADWSRCGARARAALAERFPGGVRYRRGVHLAAGERAG